MSVLEIHVRLELTCPCQPEVQMWFDPRPDMGLESEMKLALWQRGTLHLAGTAAVPDIGHFTYRLGVVAHAGARWSLEIHERDRGMLLLNDGDELAGPKCWLVGTCQLPGVQPDKKPRGAHRRPMTRSRAILRPPRDTIARCAAGLLLLDR